MIVWLIGMSGAGKSTVAGRLAQRWRSTGRDVVLLDGDVLREVWGDNPGHTVAGRRINAERISRLCKMLDDQGIDVVAAVLSIFPEWQAWNRKHFRRYWEVFLDVPFEVLEARDTKGLYRAAREGLISDVVGVDIPFPRPTDPDLVLDSSGAAGDPDTLASQIFASLPDVRQ